MAMYGLLHTKSYHQYRYQYQYQLIAPSTPNQVQDKLSAVGLVMQAKTLALKSCSANQRWCNVRTKTTVQL